MADTADSRKRWDTDDRLTGVADAGGFAPAIDELPPWPSAPAGSPKTRRTTWSRTAPSDA
jgi:hypothetical protein